MWIYLFLFFKEKYKFKNMRIANIGTRIATMCAIGKVSPSEYKYSFRLSTTAIKSEKVKKRMLQNSDFKNALPE